MAQYQMNEQQIMQTAQRYQQAIQKKEDGIARLNKVLQDINNSIAALEEVKNVNGKMMVKLGAGVLIEVEAKNLKKCKRGFSDNGYIEEKIPDTLKWLKEKKTRIEKNVENENKSLQKMGSDLSQMISVLRQIESEKKKNFSRQ